MYLRFKVSRFYAIPTNTEFQIRASKMWTCLVLFLQTMIWINNLQYITGNSFAPEILSVNINERIPENTKFGVTIATVTASDSDSLFPDNDIRFQMFASQLASDYIAVDSLTGNIFVKRDLTLDTSNIYQVYVRAYDMGSPSRPSATTATVTINVYRNLLDPFFPGEPFSASISETIVTSTSILQVNVSDRDTDAPFNTVTLSAIGDDKALTYFRLDSNGRIVVNGDLKADPDTQYMLRILAQDGGSPPRTATTVASITVQRNINSPVFERLSYNETILETRQLGLPILQVKATDGDTRAPNNQLRYFIEGSNTTITDFFMVNEDSGDVMLRRSMLDYPNTATRFTVNFQVTAEDKGSVPLVANNPQLVSISVVRNTAPFFENKFTYNAEVQQFAPGGTVVFTSQGRDDDTDSPFNVLTYSLIGDDAATTVFQINPNTGAISTRPTTNLTQTTGNSVARVQVTDGGSPPLSDTATVQITIQRNRETPRFLHALDLTRNIPETLPAGSEIIDLNATDDDFFVPNNVISYEITDGDGNPLEYFFIHPSTGFIVLLKSVKSISTSNFRLTVEARDQGAPMRLATATVRINVLRDTGVLAFSTNNYNVTISENIPVGSSVTTTVASPGTSIEYSLLGVSSGPDYFSVNAATGQVTVRQLLTSDPARLTFYQLRVQAINRGVATQTATATVNIGVTRNENGPVFRPSNTYTTTVEDTIPLGSSVTLLSATDADGDQLNYRILSGSPYTDLFYLNPVTGQITLKNVLQGRPENQYMFQVLVNDQRTPERTTNATVIVNIIKDQFAPQFFRTPYFSVTTENTPDGTIIFSTEAFDQDLKERIEYTVIGDNTAPAFFGVIPDKGNITIINQALLRKDLGTSYTLRLTAHDTRYPNNRATATVTVRVTRNLNSPVFFPPSYSRTILDTVPLGYLVVQVNATDGDNDPIRYSITGDPRAQTYYYINPETGLITVKQLLTMGNWLHDLIVVQACDLREPQKCVSTFATITIDRNEQSPFFENTPYSTSLGQGTTASESVIFTVGARDPDLNPSTGSLRYETIGNYPAPSFFSLNTTTGEIRVARGLMEDGLQRSQYNLVVIAYDTQYLADRATATVTFNVNRNPNSPVFTQSGSYRVTIPENLPLGSNVTQVLATDADNDVVSYFISPTGNTGQEDLGFFYLNAETGVITLKSFLTSTILNTFTFDVVARDPGGKTGNAVVTVSVTRDQPPVFVSTPYRTSVVENQQINSKIFAVSVYDSDVRGLIQYETIGIYPAPSFFDVEKYTGVIRIIRDLKEDRIATETYNLFIVAYDTIHPNKKATSEVIINVQRTPASFEFSQTIYTVQLPEITPVGSSILQVFPANASDSAMYAIESSLPLSGVNIFNMDAVSGIITTKISLQSGSNYFYQLEVKATNKANPARSGRTIVFVIVEDFCCLSSNRTCELNSNAPIFSAPLYFVNVMEGDYSSNNQPLIEVSASDNDFGPNGDLVFEIQSVSNNGDGKFKIQQTPSEKKASLICIGKISRDLTYVIVIRTSDQAIHVSRKRSSFVPVEIKVVPFRN